MHKLDSLGNGVDAPFYQHILQGLPCRLSKIGQRLQSGRQTLQMSGLLAHDRLRARVKQRTLDALALDDRHGSNIVESLLQGAEQRTAALELLDAEGQGTEKDPCQGVGCIADEQGCGQFRINGQLVIYQQSVDSGNRIVGWLGTFGSQELQPRTVVTADSGLSDGVMNVLCESRAQSVAEKIGSC